MGNFNRFNKGGNGGGFGGGGFGGGRKFGGGKDRDRDRAPRQMHPATCSDCGASCEVPFKPTGAHPVFCSNCFQGKDAAKPRFAPNSFDGARSGGFSGGRDRDRGASSAGAPAGISKAQIDALHEKLDRILSLLKPRKTDDISFVRVEQEEKPAKVKTVEKKASKKTKVPVKKSVTKIEKKTKTKKK